MKRVREAFKKGFKGKIWGGETGIHLSEATEAGHPLGHSLDEIPGESWWGGGAQRGLASSC